MQVTTCVTPLASFPKRRLRSRPSAPFPSTPTLRVGSGDGRPIYATFSRFRSSFLDIADNHTLAERRKVLNRKGTLIPNSGEGGRVFGSVGRIVKAWLVTPFVSQRLRPVLSLSKRDDLSVLRDLIEAGELEPVVGATYSLADAAAAIRHAGSGHARGKVSVTI